MQLLEGFPKDILLANAYPKSKVMTKCNINLYAQNESDSITLMPSHVFSKEAPMQISLAEFCIRTQGKSYVVYYDINIVCNILSTRYSPLVGSLISLVVVNSISCTCCLLHTHVKCDSFTTTCYQFSYTCANHVPDLPYWWVINISNWMGSHQSFIV